MQSNQPPPLLNHKPPSRTQVQTMEQSKQISQAALQVNTHKERELPTNQHKWLHRAVIYDWTHKDKEPSKMAKDIAQGVGLP